MPVGVDNRVFPFSESELARNHGKGRGKCSNCRLPLGVVFISWTTSLVLSIGVMVVVTEYFSTKSLESSLSKSSREVVNERIYRAVENIFNEGIEAAYFTRDYTLQTPLLNDTERLIWRKKLNTTGRFEEGRVLYSYSTQHPAVRLIGFWRYSSREDQTIMQVETVTRGIPLFCFSDNSTGYEYGQYHVNTSTSVFFKSDQAYKTIFYIGANPLFPFFMSHEGIHVSDPYQIILPGLESVLTLVLFNLIEHYESGKAICWRAAINVEALSAFVEYFLPDVNEPVLAATGKYLESRYDNMSMLPRNFSVVTTFSGVKTVIDVTQWRLNENSTTIWIILVSPAKGPSSQYLAITGLCISIFTLVGIIASTITSMMIKKPLGLVAKLLGSISQLDFESKGRESNFFKRNSPIREIDDIQTSYYSLEVGLKSLSCYVPGSLAKLLVRSDYEPQIGVKEGNCTVMFLDVQGFSTLCETVNSEKVFTALGECFDSLSTIICSYGGTIDKPEYVDNHPSVAMHAVFECQNKITELQAQWTARGLPCLHVKFGLSTGPVLVGNVGGSKRFSYTVIGRTVNLAAGLEPLTRILGVDVLISEELFQCIKSTFICRKLPAMPLKGFALPVHVYEPLCMISDKTERLADMLNSFNFVMEAKETPSISQLRTSRLEEHCRIFPEDAAAAKMLDSKTS
ncbi:adenylate cyclase [Pelomyxa schiedti]|nr:adenylate cyclase [Pelomyxa schiedti]